MNIRYVLSLLILVFTIPALTGCGPDDSVSSQVRQEREEQAREDFRIDKAALDKVVGTYVGHVINGDLKKVYPARLVIRHVTILVTSPNNRDVTRIPSIGGDLSLLPEKEGENEILLGLYTVGDFDPVTNEVSLWNAGEIGNGKVSLFSLSGTLNGDILSGDVTTPLKSGMRFEGKRLPRTE